MWIVRTVPLLGLQALGLRLLSDGPTIQLQIVGCVAVYHINTLSIGQVLILKDYQQVFALQQIVRNNAKMALQYEIWCKGSGRETLSYFSF